MSGSEPHHATETPVLDSLPPKSEVYISTAELTSVSTDTDRANMKKPKVLIVGAGIGGLMLDNLLQKGGINYSIFERAKDVKPLGMFSRFYTQTFFWRASVCNNRQSPQAKTTTQQ